MTCHNHIVTRFFSGILLSRTKVLKSPRIQSQRCWICEFQTFPAASVSSYQARAILVPPNEDGI